MLHNCPRGAWQLIDAEASGWQADLLAQAQQAATEFGCISAVVVHRGRLVAGIGDLEQKVLVRSIRKSFLSALIGIEVERGRICLDHTLQQLDIDDVEGLSADERSATVRHLLQARSGIYHPALAESKEMQALKPERGSKPAGSHWVYNNWDFNTLGTIYERATGNSVFEGVYSEIAMPIGMQDFAPSDGAYLTGEQSKHPAYHLKMTSRDLARFGWLYLNRGSWNGVQVVPQDWVGDSVRAHSFDGANGYGYMWWTTGHHGEAQSTRVSIYRKHMPPFRYFAHGAFGQMIAVIADRDVVIAHLATSRERSADESLKLWEFVACIMEARARLPPGLRPR